MRNIDLLELLKESEKILDEHNSDYGTKDKYCLCCGSNRYNSRVGIIHFKNCIINRIRNKLKENDNSTDTN